MAVKMNQELHEIYNECKRLNQEYNGFVSGKLIEKIENDEERRFAIHISNFFLAERQRELIEKGVF